jgi:hypothetical protein
MSNAAPIGHRSSRLDQMRFSRAVDSVAPRSRAAAAHRYPHVKNEISLSALRFAADLLATVNVTPAASDVLFNLTPTPERWASPFLLASPPASARAALVRFPEIGMRLVHPRMTLICTSQLLNTDAWRLPARTWSRQGYQPRNSPKRRSALAAVRVIDVFQSNPCIAEDVNRRLCDDRLLRPDVALSAEWTPRHFDATLP